MYPQEMDDVESVEAVDDDEEDTEDITFENERCGICADIIIDRGVLDCCDDWFCFACIDNWATVTNCCPICKNVFQLITCLPVYDTTGSISIDNYLLSRDDDWSIQGKNNTLSFPSYYIDEDAVACLDGDGCKVRSRLTTPDNELSFDTSIACDSCDIWYHAFCVGFQPESAAVSSWLCPRCLYVEEPDKMGHLSLEEQGRNSDLNGVELGWEVDHSFLGKVSVSVADDGETALVVSMVQADQRAEDKIGASVENWEETNVKNEIESFSSASIVVVNPKPNDPAENIGSSELKGLSQGESTSLFHPVIHSSMEANCVEETVCSSNFNEHEGSFSLSCSSYQSVAELPQDKFGELVDVAAKNPLVMSRSLHGSEECNISVDGIITSSVEDVVNAICQEDFKAANALREHTVETNLPLMDVDSMRNHNEKRKQEFQAKSKAKGNAKKPKLDRTHLMMPSQSQANACNPDYDCHPKAVIDCKDEKIKYAAEDEATPTDIMSIVREDHKPNDSQTGRKSVNKFVERRDNSAGLRVKKIMRRIGDKTDKENIVQKLQKEIKEAVQDNTFACNIQDNAFHGKLLTAFREAIKPTVVDNKPNHSLGKRKQLLKKGKIRENLTKKIYGTSNGRRKRAWDRDWEIEFWKYRCPKVKPEKVETLQSVLELLKKATIPTENLEMDQGPEGVTKNSILSRVYLADASVFPRKDDIKPLSAIAVNSNENKERSLITNISETDSQTIVNNISNGPKLPTNIQPSDNQGININVPIIPKKATCKIRNTSVQNIGTSPASAASTLKGKGPNVKEKFVSDKKERILKEPDNLSAMDKIDKKKWAMEVLARKNASSSGAAKDLQQDGSTLGGKYPLLAQLPIDMKPVVAPSRQNKIPISVRQAQLSRIAEHFLKRTDLSVICRTAEVELAVADAVNVEKNISDRSNSKTVYVNLCAQVIAQCTKQQSEADPSNLLGNSNSSDDQAVESTGNCIDQVAKETISESTPLVFTDVEQALRVAGLSDSPPSSPEKTIMASNADVHALKNSGEQNLGNVLDIDTLSQFNTHADSENKSIDDAYSAASDVAKSSKVSELENGNAKKVVHSSTECTGKEPPIHTVSTEAITNACQGTDEGNGIDDENGRDVLAMPNHESNNCSDGDILGDKVSVKVKSSKGGEIAPTSEQDKPSTSESSNSIYKKVEAYVKEHIRPLCKSGVITVEQYRWAVGRTTDKVVARHCESKNANFLIKEGDKVKRLAEQYAEVAQQKMQ